jgi:hypothetical protein
LKDSDDRVNGVGVGGTTLDGIVDVEVEPEGRSGRTGSTPGRSAVSATLVNPPVPLSITG